jgi:hypothetical protein
MLFPNIRRLNLTLTARSYVCVNWPASAATCDYAPNNCFKSPVKLAPYLSPPHDKDGYTCQPSFVRF